jgi:uncharacterized membrane protein YphA (DoxX/SURF4 family)
MMEVISQIASRTVRGQPRSFSTLVFFLARLFLGGVFIYASLDKILHPLAFAKSINNYQILPDRLINLTAIILPWLELILGSLLLFGIWLPGAVTLINLLLTAFFAALLFNIARGLNIDCGCFSASANGSSSTLWYVIRDAVFLFVGAFLFYRSLIKPAKPFDQES